MYNTPYYLAGNAKYRYHQQKAAKSFKKGAAVGVLAGATLHHKTRLSALKFLSTRVNAGEAAYVLNMYSKHIGIGAGVVAGGLATHSAIHYAKSRKLKKEYYYAKRGKKTVRVKKGRRK